MEIESASIVEAKSDDPKMKKVKIERTNDPKDKQGKIDILVMHPLLQLMLSLKMHLLRCARGENKMPQVTLQLEPQVVD